MSRGFEGDDPQSANEDVAKLRLQLREISLVELDSQDVVDWDVDAAVVRKGSRFNDRWAIFDRRSTAGI